ncbi:serine/threonine protein kinase [Actinoplanes cyaneus]|uniref:Serine/threonine protein kinase n=1 Tax=Actinoplanes cyaneus TaxID=52696 RepID=A0A919IKE9_9ACTN|nr:YncE family protein [Actinoplanes cyaneus]MCW2140019.1 PQQ-like domain-containing protein [Actinoplanes cyaneus]GID67680.1 serine/threonine protein kinase [Actinoplanes cyaneus]
MRSTTTAAGGAATGHLWRLLGAAAAAVALGATATTSIASASPASTAAALREVMFVGNNWEGTADVINSRGDFAKIGRINVVPDKSQRLAEIYLNPIKLIYFLGIRSGPGEGHDQLVDDLYSTPDGTALVASRPSFADVVSVDLATGKLKWRFPVSGYRADHMAVSPDGTKVAVSASTANTVHVLDINTGAQVGSFATGDKPHENVYTDGGRYLWNMSIGNVETDLDSPGWDWTKGDRHITVVDTSTYRVVKTIDMRARLDAFGRSDLSNAVRPAVFSPDSGKLYFQVSFFNGLVEYDVATDKVTRVKTLPKNPATSDDRTTYVNDSRHHGLSMSPDGSKLCVAGTMDDYATVVDRASLQEGPQVPASKPYWATVSGDGRNCVISESGADQVTAIDFATGRKVVSVPVGDHPQRVRLAHVPAGWTGPAA